MNENTNQKKKFSLKSKKLSVHSMSNFDFRMSIKSKTLKEEQLKYDKLIEELSNEISKKLSFGLDELNLKLSKEYNLQDIVKYILKKNNRNKKQITILRYFLFQNPTLLETMNLTSKYLETKEILNKIAIHIKKEEIPQNNVVFYNGQIGKTFYIILEGEVSILIPAEYNANITMDKYLEYLKLLYQFKDYELLRLSYESNKKILNKYEYEMGVELKNFDYCLDKVIPNNYKKEEINVENYINRFLFMEKEEEKNKNDTINNIKIIDIKSINKIQNNISENYKNNSLNDNSNSDENINNNSSNSSISNYSIVQKNYQENNQIKSKLSKKLKKHNFSLWKYVEITKLGKGKCFGEIALQNSKNKRTATIIALVDCLFGILGKDEYSLFVKETMEKIRRNNIERLLNSKLFQGISYITFESKFFNCFTFSKEKKGTYLFKRGKKRNNLIYIKKGEIQLEIVSSCKQLDNIILSIGGNPYDEYLNNLIKTNKKINDFINVQKIFNISIFSQGDIIGTDELVYISSNEFDLNKYNNYKNYISNNINNNKLEENCFLFNGIYLTNCEIFKLDLHFLRNMLKDKIIKNNYDKLYKEKKERLIERLLNIKSNTILQYYNLISESKKSLNINNLNEKKHYNFLFNKKKNINNNHFFSVKNFKSLDYQNNNKINTANNTRNNSFFDNISKKKGKTKDFFYPEQTGQKRNDNNDLQKRALLTSFMNNNNYKGNLIKKTYFSGNNTLHKFETEKTIEINENKTFYNSNNKRIYNFRNTMTNFSNNNTALSNEENLSKNNSSNKMSTFNSFYLKKKPKKIKLDEALTNYFRNPELKMLNIQKIPKLLMNHVLIYNTVIDKILLKPNKTLFKNPILIKNNDNKILDFKKKYKEGNKINTLDALAFDDILNEIKKTKILNKKKILPIVSIKKKKNMFIYSLPKTSYNFFTKKNKHF